MRRHERKQWATARTLDDLGELMALWLEGEIKSRPGYYGSTDLDTPGLTALCAALCRAGFVTTDSQRAWLGTNHRGNRVRARAAVSGFCDDARIARLHATARDAGVSVLAQRGTPGMDGAVVVTEVNGSPYYWAGGYPGRDDLIADWSDVWSNRDRSGLRRGISWRAFRAVRASWYVAIIDPEWGRNDLLVDTLTSRFLGLAA